MTAHHTTTLKETPMSDELCTLLDEMRQRQDEHLDAMDGKTPAWWGDIVSDNINLLNAVEAVLNEHRPVEVEPSDTICGECSFRLPNGRYFGKIVEFPCPTVAAIRTALIGDDDD